MKTEKRLTMALSVLVALMMLAVPLASSSNLFVDGGQTNSNGDAPMLSASTGYTVTFQLNADGKSLDQIENLNDTTDADGSAVKGVVSKLNDLNITGVSQWYLNESGDLCALVMYDKDTPDANVHIQTLINALFDESAPNASNISKGLAYNLTSWKDTKSNLSYEYSNIDGSDNSAVINSDMTFAAQWELKEETYIEVPVNVVVDGETKEYYKAYELKGNNSNQINIVEDDLNEAILDAADLSLFGIVVYGMIADFVKYEQIYKDGIVTYGNDNDLPDDKMISSKSTLTVTYTFDDKKYSKLTVSSAAFEDGKDITLYINKASVNMITYNTVLASLFVGFEKVTEGYNLIDDLTAIADADVKPVLTPDSDKFDPSNILTGEGYNEILTDDGYLLSGWNNGAELLNSVNFVPSGTTQITLDAELNGYYVIFMSKGAYELVYVPFGELSADLVKTLDVAGVNHWAYVAYNNYKSLSSSTTFTTFTSFTDRVKTTFDEFGKTAVNGATPKEPVAVLVACFDLASKTAYAVFDANNYDAADLSKASISGDFGNKYVNKIIIPGTTSKESSASLISTPAVSPVYEEGNLFINYRTYDTTGSKWMDYAASGDDASKYSEDADDISIYSANVVGYAYTITFYNGSDVVGMLYYNKDAVVNDDSIVNSLVAFFHKGTAYDATGLDLKDSSLDKTKAFNSILYPAKDGYSISQWKDADGNVMLDKVDKEKKTYSVKFDKVSSDMSFYANFKAEEYLIAYNGNTATATNNMPQIGTVDSSVNLFSDAAFSNDGYKLKEWNTRPDGKGTTYALGASFTLTGEQYKDLKGVPSGSGLPANTYEKGFTLYAIWEKVGSSDNPSGNTDGDNDNSNTDTYLLAGILVVIIILIIVVAVVLRKKN
ncbi:hypothetical protein MMINT_01150 [Candidatus Methanomassiliicoccus intestinalis Issoire-Mx1]|uniref:Uncharacterized protein n=1 Tax=Methanomassiliicoccus intestinalis (strain Issoire-Mx1) TaxID=1295009 RepID=R9T851_METII|nr:hypothetical protein [Candidatus Methanomassiliicoccus intestinalis]AGN25523.1 hypothetical protein MMINT_01150 [Candidatus Methanomassiliicoccus intestinalis Issoire-Mx1]